MVLRLPSGGKGFNGAAHSQNIETLVTNVPGLIVAIPSNAADAKGLLKTAVRSNDPVVFIEEKLLYATSGEVPDDPEYLLPFGKASVARPGRDVTVVAYGYLVSRALLAAEQRAKEGVEVEVIDPRTLNPFDLDTVLASVRKTGRVVIAHQACKTGGFGGEISALIAEHAFESLKKPILRVGALDAPVAANAALEACALPNERSIVDAVRTLLA